MKLKSLLSTIVMCIAFCLFGCSDEGKEFIIHSGEFTNIEQDMQNAQDSVIVPIEGTRTSIQRSKRAVPDYPGDDDQQMQEELDQLDEIPIYLQVQGNSDKRQFLSAAGKGKELTVEEFDEKSEDQQFYLKKPSAFFGIPYLIYSKKTGTPISIGFYKKKPDVKVLYARKDIPEDLFGCSWGILRAQYSPKSYIIENRDLPQKGNSGFWLDTYYNVITINGSKISFSKYSNSPRQEFKIIPVEEFKVEDVVFDIEASTILTKTPSVIFSDEFTNNSPIIQEHSFSVSKNYKTTSSFSQRTSYSINVSTEFKVKVPFIASEFFYGKTEEHSETLTHNVKVTVPANHIAYVSFTLYTFCMAVPYTAICIGKISGRKIKIKGVWNGISVELSTGYINTKPINGNATGAKSFPITDEMIKTHKP